MATDSSRARDGIPERRSHLRCHGGEHRPLCPGRGGDQSSPGPVRGLGARPRARPSDRALDGGDVEAGLIGLVRRALLARSRAEGAVAQSRRLISDRRGHRCVRRGAGDYRPRALHAVGAPAETSTLSSRFRWRCRPSTFHGSTAGANGPRSLLGGAEVRAMTASPYLLKSDPSLEPRRHSLPAGRRAGPSGARCRGGGRLSGGAPHAAGLAGDSALERDPAQAAKARGRCHEVIIADLDQAAPRLQGPFDAIVYGDVLEHLNDPLPVLVALDRALATDGRVIVSVPNVAHLWVQALARPRALGLRGSRYPRPHPPAFLHEAELRGAPPRCRPQRGGARRDARAAAARRPAAASRPRARRRPRRFPPAPRAPGRAGSRYQFVAVCRRASAGSR